MDLFGGRGNILPTTDRVQKSHYLKQFPTVPPSLHKIVLED